MTRFNAITAAGQPSDASLDANGFLVFGGTLTLPTATVSLADFGAAATNNSADASTNNTAIANAIAALPAYGGVIRLPAAQYEYAISAVPDPGSKVVTFAGDGSAPFQGGLTGSGAWHPVSTLKWFGSSGANVIANTPLTKMDFRDIAIDCNSLAARGFLLDRWQYSTMQNVVVRNFATEAVKLTDTGTTANEGSRHNIVQNLLGMGGPTLLRLSGNTGHTANSCHNKFIAINGHLDGTANGIILEDADNNVFIQPWMFGPKPSTNGFYGIECQARGRQNYFFHVQSEIMARTPFDVGANASANIVFGYDRSNGQDAPTLESGARLTWTTDGAYGDGWHLERVVNSGATPSISTSATGAGSGSTASILGTDQRGKITLNTGTSPGGFSLAFITLVKPFAVKPYVTITPANANAAALPTTASPNNQVYSPYAENFVGQFQLWNVTNYPTNTTTGLLAASTTYEWYYSCGT